MDQIKEEISGESADFLKIQQEDKPDLLAHVRDDRITESPLKRPVIRRRVPPPAKDREAGSGGNPEARCFRGHLTVGGSIVRGPAFHPQP